MIKIEMLDKNGMNEVFGTIQDLEMGMMSEPKRSDLFRVMKEKVWEEPEASEYVIGDLDISNVARMLGMYGDEEEGSYSIQLGTFQIRMRHKMSGTYTANIYKEGEQIVLRFIAHGYQEEEIVTDPQVKMELINRWKEV